MTLGTSIPKQRHDIDLSSRTPSPTLIVAENLSRESLAALAPRPGPP